MYCVLQLFEAFNNGFEFLNKNIKTSGPPAKYLTHRQLLVIRMLLNTPAFSSQKHV